MQRGGAREEAANQRSQRRAHDPPQLQPYVLSSDREPLNSRLGPADFYPPSSDDPELVLSRETVSAGYKEAVPAIEESREVLYSLVSAQALWTRQGLQRCRAALRARFRALASTLARKRKAGQVFGVPLAGPLLARPGAHPEVKPAPSEEARQRWLAEVALGKPLRQLADSVPAGFYGRPLVEGILRARLPVGRATWVVKVCYLGQAKRTDAWTRDLLAALDDALAQAAGEAHSAGGAAGKLGRLSFSPVTSPLAGQSSPGAGGGLGGGLPGEQWAQLMALAVAHCGEGLVNSTALGEWVLAQFGDMGRGVARVGLLLPLVEALLDGALWATPQTHLEQITGAALSSLEQLCLMEEAPDRASAVSDSQVALRLGGLVRCVLVASPDSFLGVGALPLPSYMLSCGKRPGVVEGKGEGALVAYQDTEVLEEVQRGVLRKRALLAAAVNPIVLRNNEAKVIAALDKALLLGDVGAACTSFSDPLVSRDWDGGEEWEGRGKLRAAVGLVCEWAIHPSRNEAEKTGGVGSGQERLSEEPVEGGLLRSDDAAHSCVAVTGTLALARVYLAAAILWRLSKEQTGSSREPEARADLLHELLVDWLQRCEAPTTDVGQGLQEALLAELVRRGLLDPVRFARQLVADGALERRASASERACARKLRGCLEQLPAGEEVNRDGKSELQMERRAALAAGQRKLRGGGAKLEQSGEEERRRQRARVERAIRAVLELPGSRDGSGNNEGAEARHRPAKRQKMEHSVGKERGTELVAVDRWWLRKSAENDWRVQEVSGTREDMIEDLRKEEGRGAMEVDGTPLGTAGLGRIQEDPSVWSWGEVEGAIGGLPFLDKREVGSWVVESIRAALSGEGEQTQGHTSGAWRGQHEAAGREEEVRWHDRKSEKAGMAEHSEVWSEAEPEVSLGTGGSWAGGVVRCPVLLRGAYLLDALQQHGALLDLLLDHLASNRSSDKTHGAQDLASPPGGAKQEAACPDECLLALLLLYAPLFAAMDRLPDLLSALVSRGCQGAMRTREAAAGLMARLRVQYGQLQDVRAWEAAARARPECSTVWEAVGNAGRTLPLGSVLGVDVVVTEQLQNRCRSGLAMETGGPAQLARMCRADINRNEGPHQSSWTERSAESRMDELACRVGARLRGVLGGDVGSAAGVAAVVGALVEAAADGLVAEAGGPGEGGVQDLVKRQRRGASLLAFCISVLRRFRGLSAGPTFQSGVVHALVHTVQAAQPAPVPVVALPYAHMSPETPDLGPETTGEAAGDPAGELSEAVRAAMALAVAEALLAEGWLELRTLLEALHLGNTLVSVHLRSVGPPPDVGAARAAVLWFRLLLGGVCSGGTADAVGGAVTALVEGPHPWFLLRARALLPADAVYAPLSALLRLTFDVRGSLGGPEMQLLKAEAAAALAEALQGDHVRDCLLADSGRLLALMRSDSAQAAAAVGVDAQRTSGEVGSWQAAALALLPLHGTRLLAALLEGRAVAPETAGGETAEERVAALEGALVEGLLRSLEALAATTFHWQCLRVRLLLDQQVVLEKLRAGSTAVAALACVHSLDPAQLAECEKTFTTAVLTRLLLRPAAAPLYSQLAHALGRGFGDYLIQQVRWALEGADMLQGRKSLRQLLEASAARDGFRVRPSPAPTPASPPPTIPPFALERGLAELVLPLLAGSSSETCAGFAGELVRQLAALEAHISAAARHASKGPSGESSAPARGAAQWGKGLDGFAALPGSPRGGGGQWGPASEVAAPASVAALQTSLWLRLQFVLPMLPQIHADRDPTPRNMRLTLAPVLLRLLASPLVQEAPLIRTPSDPLPPDPERGYAEAAAAAAAAGAGEGLFGRLHAVLAALVSSTWAAWLKPPPGRGPAKPLRDVGPFDRHVAERMQAELDSLRGRLPAAVHQRLQAVLPCLPPHRCTIPTIAAVNKLSTGSSHLAQTGRGPLEGTANWATESGLEMDPWLLLEEGATGRSSNASSETSVAPKAAPWLKGAVRVARKELTYAPKEEEVED
ncbi:hypothetical protein KFL_007770030 [Klebsormidium nitens]|uniref:Mediator complex subunit Med12 domain-containing protein n=1 Tax=Klebsormidium nitens TaxID=105231 RepID=A0A1Y1IMN0_KLENI|nr:hypothetical protein KFL_007770030 [Klebsormidium nitens]|eukprot:GAQ91392.1 hypothetical protein KFL_007770030 [Klebsormidium nitens]